MKQLSTLTPTIIAPVHCWGDGSDSGSVFTVSDYPNVHVGDDVFKKSGSSWSLYSTVSEAGSVYIKIPGVPTSLVKHAAGDTTMTVAITHELKGNNIVSGYLYNGQFYRELSHLTTLVPESGKIYIDRTTDQNIEYIWDGKYIPVGNATTNTADIEGLKRVMTILGDLRVRNLSSDSIPKVTGAPLVLIGAGVPSESVIPDGWDAETMGEWTGVPMFIGQLYINSSAASAGLYYAKGDSAVSDWKNA